METSNTSVAMISENLNFGISDEMTATLKWIIYIGLCQSIDIFGMVTNIINVICFVKQGFKDPVTISLVGLSISDFGCLMTLLCTNVLLLTSAGSSENLTFDPMAINYLVNFMPHLAFARVTSWITAIITMERCLCIVAPLKVKNIITHKRMGIIIVSVFIILFFTGAPVYTVNRLQLRFSYERNTTILGLVRLEGRDFVEMISFAINNFFIPFTAFIIIIICTVILVVKLEKVSRWRQISTNHVAGNVSSRNQKVAKMVAMISILFISCFIPLSIVMLTLSFLPELSLNGKYLNIGIVLGGIGFLLESINSSVNVFIYYYMSSKYREAFNTLFCTREMNVIDSPAINISYKP